MKSSNSGGASDTYTYDQLNRLSTVTDASGATTYAYDAVGNLQNFTYPNGVTHAYSYDTLNRLTQVGASKNAVGISNYAYTLGLAGNRLTVAELSGRTVNYGYDSLYRLTSEAVSNDPNNHDGTTSYIYDSVGNRQQLLVNGVTANSYTYDADDRLGSDQYDADGNTINSLGTANTYDFENHLATHGGVTLLYDGDGNRVSETVGGVTTSYLVDTVNPTGYAQVVDELQGGAVNRTYSFGLDRISETQTLNSAQTTSFYGYDGHGSVRQLTNSTGAVTDTYDYDAFGNIVDQSGSTPNSYLFVGEQYDPSLSLYYNRARYLNTTTGRFWNMDDVEGDSISPISLHKYLYAANNPVNAVDPSGHDFDLGSTVSALGDSDIVGSAEDEEAFTAEKAFSTKIFDAYFVIGPSNFRSVGSTPIVHAFIYMNTITTGAGTRYDVSLNNPYETFSSAIFGVSPGIVVQSPATLASIESAAFTFTYKVASLSTLQWLAWQGAVEALPVDTEPVSIPYSIVNMVVGTNCIKWSVEDTASQIGF